MKPASLFPPEQVIELLERHGQMLFKLGLKILHNYEDAEDCLQEAAILMLRFWHTCRNEQTRRAWACALVVNKAMSMRRAREYRGYRLTVPVEPAEEGGKQLATCPSHESGIIAKMMLVRACRHLSPIERETVARYVRGYPAPSGYQKTRRRRAIRKLRALCGGRS